MAERVDPDDLLDSGEVAKLLGLAWANSIPTYRDRYEDFPVPRVSKQGGRCLLWLKPDIEAWMAAHGRTP